MTAALHPWALVLAAGSGSRLAGQCPHRPKQFLPYQGAPLYWHSALTLSRVAAMAGLIFVFPEDCLDAARAELHELDKQRILGLPWHCVAGGQRRQDSVLAGLHCLKAEAPHCQAVLIHDSARPFASATLIQQLCAGLAESPPCAGIIPALPVTDTIKIVDGATVLSTPDRDKLCAVQTPQAFLFAPLLAAHQECARQKWTVTDDASLLERCGQPVRTIPGEAANRKLTHPEDLSMLHHSSPLDPRLTGAGWPCTGFGYDVHRYGTPKGEAAPKGTDQPARPMILGGVPIPKAPTVIAHSDGDVLLHALMDALLSCACLGDIGQHFPDSAAAYANISSALLLDEVLQKIRQAGLCPLQVDVTLIAQIPKIAPHRAAIQRNVARLMALDAACVNIKASTEEGLGFTGAKQGIKAVAVVSAWRKAPAGPADETGQRGPAARPTESPESLPD